MDIAASLANPYIWTFFAISNNAAIDDLEHMIFGMKRDGFLGQMVIESII